MLAAFKARLGWEASGVASWLGCKWRESSIPCFSADCVEEELGVRKGSRGADFDALAQKNPSDAFMACVLEHADGTSPG